MLLVRTKWTCKLTKFHCRFGGKTHTIQGIPTYPKRVRKFTYKGKTSICGLISWTICTYMIWRHFVRETSKSKKCSFRQFFRGHGFVGLQIGISSSFVFRKHLWKIWLLYLISFPMLNTNCTRININISSNMTHQMFI